MAYTWHTFASGKICALLLDHSLLRDRDNTKIKKKYTYIYIYVIYIYFHHANASCHIFKQMQIWSFCCGMQLQFFVCVLLEMAQTAKQLLNVNNVMYVYNLM